VAKKFEIGGLVGEGGRQGKEEVLNLVKRKQWISHPKEQPIRISVFDNSGKGKNPWKGKRVEKSGETAVLNMRILHREPWRGGCRRTVGEAQLVCTARLLLQFRT